MDWEKATAFWSDDDGQPLVLGGRAGEEFWEGGCRFVWAVNQFGTPYRKSLGQVGWSQAQTYTIQEYAATMKAYSEAHAAALPPEVRAMIGREVVLADMFAPPPMPPAAVDSSPGLMAGTYYAPPSNWAQGYF
jgi:hypothetical protein